MAHSGFSDEMFGRRLRQARTQRGVTQRELAEWMTSAGQKMVQTTIAKIEAAERPATITEAVYFAMYFNINVADLVRNYQDGFDSVVDQQKDALERAYMDAKLKVGRLQSDLDKCEENLYLTQARYAEVGHQLAMAKDELIEIEGEIEKLDAL